MSPKRPTALTVAARWLRLLLVPLCLVATCAPGGAAGSPSLHDPRGWIRVDGRPRLILGMYENPSDDHDLAEAVNAGFNLFACPPETNALDRIQRARARAWVNLGAALDLSAKEPVRKAQLATLVNRFSSHPALLLWEGPDEILWNQWWGPMETLRAELRTMDKLAASHEDLRPVLRRVRSCFDRGLYPEFQTARDEFWHRSGQPCPNPGVRVEDAPSRVRQVGEGITAGIRHVRSLDPTHAVWLNHAPRSSLEDLRWFNRAAHMAGCDIYPVPANLDVRHSDLTDMSLGSVGAYTERMRRAAPGRACAMVLQGFGWRDLREQVTDPQTALGIGRRPTYEESRFMAYDALLHGANAILYWGTAYMKPSGSETSHGPGRPQLWHDLLRLARELRALEPALVGEPGPSLVVHEAASYGSREHPGVIATLHQTGVDDVLIVANESGDGLGFVIDRLPRRLNGRVLHRLHSTEEHTVQEHRLEDGIRAYDVHVYATSRRFEPDGR